MRFWLRLDIVRLFLLALPVLAVFLLLLDLEASWAVAAVCLAVAVAAWAFWQLDDGPVALGPRFLVFFLAYCLLFSYAAGTELLAGPRTLLAGYDQAVPSDFLSLGRFGDWKYRVAPPGPAANDLVVVTFPSFAGEHREDVRRGFAFLIRKALEAGARGLAFDYYLAEPSLADRLLLRMLADADAKGLDVVFGYLHGRRDDLIFRRPLAPELAEAIPLERLGHLAGYREADGLFRRVPVDLPGNRGLPSLSWRVATILAGEVEGPRDGLLQFLQPPEALRVVPFSPQLDPDLLRDRFLIVGTSSETDRVSTPFGELQGVVVHAYAAHGLRAGHFVRRLDRRATFPLIFLLCYVLAVREARCVRRRALVATAVFLSLGAVAAAATAMRFGRLWIELSHPLVAIWTLTAVLAAGRAVRAAWKARRPTRRTAPLAAPLSAAASGAGFDVFMSHNSRDKESVRTVAREIESRDLRPWLDQEQLVPGRSWQEALEAVLATVRSSAVFVGPSGLGPWEVPEIRVSLMECVRRGMPVIPVLLPDAGERPVLPLFLTQYTWVDLRAGLTEAGLDRLEWGITGVKPGAAQRV